MCSYFGKWLTTSLLLFIFLKSMVSTSSGLMLKAPNNYILYLSWIYLLTKKTQRGCVVIEKYAKNNSMIMDNLSKTIPIVQEQKQLFCSFLICCSFIFCSQRCTYFSKTPNLLSEKTAAGLAQLKSRWKEEWLWLPRVVKPIQLFGNPLVSRSLN